MGLSLLQTCIITLPSNPSPPFITKPQNSLRKDTFIATNQPTNQPANGVGSLSLYQIIFYIYLPTVIKRCWVVYANGPKFTCKDKLHPDRQTDRQTDRPRERTLKLYLFALCVFKIGSPENKYESKKWSWNVGDDEGISNWLSYLLISDFNKGFRDFEYYKHI